MGIYLLKYPMRAKSCRRGGYCTLTRVLDRWNQLNES